MDEPLLNPPDPDTASDEAITALGELCSALLECRLVIAAMPEEVDMIFDDLDTQLAAAQIEARQTYKAASLLQQGALLEPRWGKRASRPKAVFARHGAAVKNGATRAIPHLSAADAFFDVLNDPGRSDLAQDLPSGKRPKCPVVGLNKKVPCNQTAFYLGKGQFAETCWAHGSEGDRDHYRRHQEEDVGRYDDRDERLRVLGRAVMQQWILAYGAQPSPAGEAAETKKDQE